MGLEWVQVSLRGHGGSEPVGTSFFETLGLADDDGFARTPGDSPWKVAIVSLLDVEMKHCLEAEEPSEEFAVRVARGLHRAAQWLSTLSPEKMNRWRESHHQADIFVGGWLDNDQFDLVLPPEFLLACGRLGLTLTICTND